MGVLRDFWMRMRQAKRVGAFVRARKQGMSEAQARAYSDALYPPTPADIAFEAKCRLELEMKKAKSFRTPS